ncbi:hypothetical protein Bbelb_313790 [Branchiostoma belcheri]|nr:hypothetical protein Bbelb_313790 [Branchiostoma belcheri]
MLGNTAGKKTGLQTRAKAFLADTAQAVGGKVQDALADEIAQRVVGNHQQKAVSTLENYFARQFDKTDAEFDQVVSEGGDLLAGLGGGAEEGWICGGGDGAGDRQGRLGAVSQEECRHHRPRLQILNKEVYEDVPKATSLQWLTSPLRVLKALPQVGYRYKQFHVPDIMTVQGIYDTDVEMYSFGSADEYRQYLEDKSAVTSANGMYKKEIMKAQGHYSGGGFGVSIEEQIILRWGTHVVTSAKFGGQLKIIKTKESSMEASQESFAKAAQADFKRVSSTYSAMQMQVKASSLVHEVDIKAEGSNSKTEATKTSSSEESKGETAASSQFEFSNEMMMVQGGDQMIAAAITEFYTPSFANSLKDWLESIDEFPKAFEFSMRPITDLLDINFDSLFPDGIMDFGCFGKDTLTEDGTGRKYYVAHTTDGNATISEIRYCNFKEKRDIEKAFTKRRMSMNRAIAVYLEEGPSLLSDFQIEAGSPGCETAGLILLDESDVGAPSWQEMISGEEFKVVFDMPYDIPNFLNGRAMLHISVGGLVMTYEEQTGVFTVMQEDFNASLEEIPQLNNWIKGKRVARADSGGGQMPCNLKWSNAHRIDPTDGGKCIHFTAASKGDIFVVFAGIPDDHETWITLEISTSAVAMYKAMYLEVTQLDKGAKGLGSNTLYQSYFVCITEDTTNSITIVQFGKTPDNEERAHVWLDHQFQGVLSLNYYAFGSGDHDVKMMGVSQIDKPTGDNVVCREGTIRDGDRCVQVCHAECNGCRTTGSNSPSDCIKCKNVRITYPYIEGDVGDFECVAVCPANMVNAPGTSDCKFPQAGTTGNIFSCFACRPGYRCALGDEQEELCPANTSSRADGTDCDPCPSGAYSNAEVVCRQLGFPGVLSQGVGINPRRKSFGESKGQIWLDNVRCTGNEDSVENCDHDGWGIHQCGHNEEISVICAEKCEWNNPDCEYTRGCGPSFDWYKYDKCGDDGKCCTGNNYQSDIRYFCCQSE